MPQTITLNEIKTLIKEEKIKPSDLYSAADLTEDPLVKGYVEEQKRTASGGEYFHRDRTDKEFKEKSKEWEDKEKKYQQDLKKLQGETAKIKAVDLFKAKIKERKLEGPQLKFVESETKYYEPQDPEKLEKEIDEFLDEAIEEYKEKAPIFGVKTEKKEEKKPGSEPAEEKQEGEASFIPD